MNRPRVVISVANGCAFVQSIRGDVDVEIRDYDVTEDGPNVMVDAAGDAYVVVNANA